MDWKTMLAYVTGSVDEELLRRNEYLVAENRILRAHIPGRVPLSDGDRRTLAEIGRRLGRQALTEIANIVRPETILAWHRRLIARKFDGSKHRTYPGRPRLDQDVEQLIVRFATDNRDWGYDRIAGALANLGHAVSDQTVGSILTRHGIPPAPERKKTTTWKDFIRSHQEVLAATDFFTTRTSRHARSSGPESLPERSLDDPNRAEPDDGRWGLPRRPSVSDSRSRKYCPAYDETVRDGGVRPVRLPPRSPNLNPHAERWVRSVKDECLSKLILFGEPALRTALRANVEHFHGERNHQGKNNLLLFPCAPIGQVGPVRCRERLGGSSSSTTELHEFLDHTGWGQWCIGEFAFVRNTHGLLQPGTVVQIKAISLSKDSTVVNNQGVGSNVELKPTRILSIVRVLDWLVGKCRVSLEVAKSGKRTKVVEASGA